MRGLLSAATAAIALACLSCDGAPPAGPDDAGTTPIDSGTIDSGTIDSGTEQDAGVETDSGVFEVPVGWTELGGMPEQLGRWGARMVAVPEERRFILFGGSTYPSGGSIGDLWSFSLDTETWTELEDSGDVPAPRYCHCLAYLPEHHQVLLVGGRNDLGPLEPEAFLLDLDTLAWSEIGGPVPRGVIGCAAEWMSNLGKAVVFGGGGAGGFDRTTWLYDPETERFSFAQTTVIPPGRTDPASAFDPTSGRMFIFGGGVQVVPPFEHREDLWAFDGNDWEEITPAGDGPSKRRFPAHGVDEVNGAWYLFSGTIEEQDLPDLWRFDFATETWTELPDQDLPEPRGFPASVWDPTTRSLAVFGGLTRPITAALTDGWRFRPE